MTSERFIFHVNVFLGEIRKSQLENSLNYCREPKRFESFTSKVQSEFYVPRLALANLISPMGLKSSSLKTSLKNTWTGLEYDHE